jgi:hypothetical protein
VQVAGDASAQALEKRSLQLLGHPERPLDPWVGVQLAYQFPAAGMITGVQEDDQPQQGTRREPVHEQSAA